jgi:hypothetical protein
MLIVTIARALTCKAYGKAYHKYLSKVVNHKRNACGSVRRGDEK